MLVLGILKRRIRGKMSPSAVEFDELELLGKSMR